jgi:hypothetical protein
MSATITLKADTSQVDLSGLAAKFQALGQSADQSLKSVIGVKKELDARSQKEAAAQIKKIADEFDGTAAATQRAEERAKKWKEVLSAAQRDVQSGQQRAAAAEEAASAKAYAAQIEQARKFKGAVLAVRQEIAAEEAAIAQKAAQEQLLIAQEAAQKKIAADRKATADLWAKEQFQDRQARSRVRGFYRDAVDEDKPADGAAESPTVPGDGNGKGGVGTGGGSGRGGIFSKISYGARASNLFMGHEQQIRMAGGSLDAIGGWLTRITGLSTVAFGGLLTGAGLAAVAFYKLNAAGSQATKGISLGFSDMAKSGQAFAAQTMSRVASSFDSAYRSAMNFVGIKVNTQEENAANEAIVARLNRFTQILAVSREIGREGAGQAARGQMQFEAEISAMNRVRQNAVDRRNQGSATSLSQASARTGDIGLQLGSASSANAKQNAADEWQL